MGLSKIGELLTGVARKGWRAKVPFRCSESRPDSAFLLLIFSREIFMSKKKSIPLAIASMLAGIACMPVAGFISTALGVGLAAMSVFLIYAAG